MGYIQPVICVWTNVCYKERNLDYEEVMESSYEMYFLVRISRLILSHFLGLISDVQYIVAASHVSPFVRVLRSELVCSSYSCFSSPPPSLLPPMCVCVCVCVGEGESLKLLTGRYPCLIRSLMIDCPAPPLSPLSLSLSAGGGLNLDPSLPARHPRELPVCSLLRHQPSVSLWPSRFSPVNTGASTAAALRGGPYTSWNNITFVLSSLSFRFFSTRNCCWTKRGFQ